eukprot:Skav231159  [mRNA]  locus=scaffold3252:162964:173512:- [translate_table: standard]
MHLALSKLQKMTHGYLSGATRITSSSVACLMLAVCYLEEQSRAFLEQALRSENKSLTISIGFDETQQRVAGAQDKEKGCDMSNHDCIVAAFRDDANYICVHRQVDPSDSKIPLSRPRLFYMGFHADVIPQDARAGEENFAVAFKGLWDKTVAGAAESLPQHRLDAFLYGHASDPALRDVPSVQRVLAEGARPWAPLARDDCDQDAQPKKKRRAGAEVQWPKLHLSILEANGAPWLVQVFCFFFFYAVVEFCHWENHLACHSHCIIS